MKNNIKAFFATGLLASVAASCTDLDVDIESQYTSYPENEVAIEAKMSDIYFQTRNFYGRRGFEALGLSSDEFSSASYDGDYVDDYAYAQPSYHTWNYENATIGWYSELTSGITKVNSFLGQLAEDADPTSYAPAKVMRAYFHWILMDGWGDTPILDHSLEDNEIVERSPRATVAQWIATELEENMDYLTEDMTEDNYGKPNKWMAKALLAKIYLNWPVYTASSVDQYDADAYSNAHLNDVVSLCDEIIASGKFSLGGGVSSWQEKFGPTNGYHVQDFIYAIPWDHTTATGMNWGRALTYRDAKNCKPTYYGCNLGQSCGGYMVLTPEMTDLFYESEDTPREEAGVRAKSIICGNAYVYDPSTYLPTTTPAYQKDGTTQIYLTKNITLSDESSNTDWEQVNVGNSTTGYAQGARTVKFFIIESDYSDSRNQSNDTPVLRYADVLLMKAEAIVRGASATNGETALSLFNQIRSYVEAPELSTTPTLDDIYDERGREFLGEGWRRNDMIRFGHYEDEYFPHYKSNSFASFDKTRRIWPICKDVLDTNSSWSQNPGY